MHSVLNVCCLVGINREGKREYWSQEKKQLIETDQEITTSAADNNKKKRRTNRKKQQQQQKTLKQIVARNLLHVFDGTIISKNPRS